MKIRIKKTNKKTKNKKQKKTKNKKHKKKQKNSQTKHLVKEQNKSKSSLLNSILLVLAALHNTRQSGKT